MDRNSARARLPAHRSPPDELSMKSSYSLRRRLIATVLLLEVALALSISGAALIYTHHEQRRAFDLMLRGRADSLLGAVQDAENAADTVTVDLHALDLRRGDLWQVIDQSGHVLAQSARWTPVCQSAFRRTSDPDFVIGHQ